MTTIRTTIFLALPVALLSLASPPLKAQTAPAAPEPGITRQQADDILNELKQIRQLLEKQAKANPTPGAPVVTMAKMNLQGAQMMGSKDAPLTIVEFTDYQCPFCQRFHVGVFSEIKKNYIDTGKARFYSRDMPLDSIHPNANRAALAARCAADQGQFWQLRNIMENNPDKLDMDSITADAKSLKMDVPNFRDCVDSQKYKAAIESDALEAVRVGADGTPAFVIGKSTAEGVDGELMVGAQPYSEFDRKLKAMEAAK